jgi:hypothetical protein
MCFFCFQLLFEHFGVYTDKGSFFLSKMVELLLDNVIEAFLKAALFFHASFGLLKSLVSKLFLFASLAG